MIDERELTIHPIVQDSVRHNAQVSHRSASLPPSPPPKKTDRKHCKQTLSNIRALTASLFGVAAGILGLESYAGFLFYALGSLVVSALVSALRVGPDSSSTSTASSNTSSSSSNGAQLFFFRPAFDLWIGDVIGTNMMGFVLTWTLFYGLVRA